MRFFYTLIFSSLLSLGTFGQKTTLPKVEAWNATVHSFNDGSYIVNYRGKITEYEWERTLVYYDANGKKVNEQKLEQKAQWDFNNDVVTISNKEAVHSIIDPEKKVSYSLYASKKEAKVYVTGADFKTKSITIDPLVFQRKWAGFDKWSQNYSELQVYSYIDTKGRAIWLIQHFKEGFAYISFDPSTEKATTKFIEHAEIGKDYFNFRFVGRSQNKTWIMLFDQEKVEKTTYFLKLYSVSDDGIVKEEQKLEVPKSTDIKFVKFRQVRNVDRDETIYLTVSIHEGNGVQGYVREIDFVKFDGKLTVAKWKTKGMELYTAVPTFTQHKSKNNIVRFVFDDNNGTGIALDVDFDKKMVTEGGGINTKNNMTFRGTPYIFNFLLYWNDLTESQKKTCKEINDNPTDVCYVFPSKSGKFIIIRGHGFFVGLKNKEEVYGEVVE